MWPYESPLYSHLCRIVHHTPPLFSSVADPREQVHGKKKFVLYSIACAGCTKRLPKKKFTTFKFIVCLKKD